MLRVNIFRTIFTTEPETVEFSRSKKIEDIGGIDFENALIFVNGFQKDKDYILRDGDVCTIRVMPAGFWKGVGTFLTGGFDNLKDLGKAIVNPVEAVKHTKDFVVNGWHAFKNNLQDWLGIEEPETPTNKNTKEKSSLESIPSLSGAKNQSGYGRPIPLALGKSRFTPYFCGNPYHIVTGDDGEEQYYTALFMLGYKDIQCTDFKLGELYLAYNKTNTVDNGLVPIDGLDGRWDGDKYDVKLELRQGKNTDTGTYARSDGECFFYPQKVVEEPLGRELIHTSDDSDIGVLVFRGTTAKYPEKIEIELTFQGLIAWDSEGNEQEKSVSVKAEISYDGGNTYLPFNTTNTTGQTGITCDSEGVYTFTRKKNKVMRFVLKKTLAYADAIDCESHVAYLRIQRTTPKDSSDSVSDNVYLSAIRTFCFNRKKSEEQSKLVPQSPVEETTRDMTARAVLRIKANEADFKNQIDAFNCIITAKGKVWDGTSWSANLSVTSNPASMVLRVLEHPSRGKYAYGFGNNKLDKFDAESLGEFYNWCNAARSTKDSTPKFQCNGMITNSKKTREIIEAILSCGRGRLILNDKKYGVWIDKPRENAVMILNNQNILSASNGKSFDDLPDGYKVKFVNEMTWQSDEIKVMFKQSDADKPGNTYETMEFIFQTDVKQVFQNAKYRLACQKLRPEVWSRKVSVDGNLLDIGSKVELQDDTISVGIGNGAEITAVVKSGNYITGIKTDGLFEVIDTTKEYGIRCTCADGSLKPSIETWQVTVTQKGFYSEFTFKAPILASGGNVPHVGDILSFGIFHRETTEALCFGKKDNGDGTFDLTLVPYQEAIYTADSDDISVDDLVFNSNVTDIKREEGSTPTTVKSIYPTIGQVAAIAQSLAGKVRELGSLKDAGVDGEIALYCGVFFQYDGTHGTWIRINASDYLGAFKNGEAPSYASLGAYFLAVETMFIDDVLVLSDNNGGGVLQLTDGTPLVFNGKKEATKGYIYLFTENGWERVDDKNDYRYVVAIDDLLKYNLSIPEKLKVYFENTATTIATQIAAEATEKNVATYTPKYLGILKTDPTVYHKGDWFVWSGTNSSTRKQGKMYECQEYVDSQGVTRLKWVEIAEEINGKFNSAYGMKFVAAVADICDLKKASDGYFSKLFCKALLATEVFASKVTTDSLTINVNTAQSTANTAKTNAATAQTTANSAKTAADNAQSTADGAVSDAAAAQSTANTAKDKAEGIIDGTYKAAKATDVFDGYVSEMQTDASKSTEYAIRSTNFEESEGKDGFCIMKNGDSFFNNGVFRGAIYADEGYFKGNIETPMVEFITKVAPVNLKGTFAISQIYEELYNNGFFIRDGVVARGTIKIPAHFITKVNEDQNTGEQITIPEKTYNVTSLQYSYNGKIFGFVHAYYEDGQLLYEWKEFEDNIDYVVNLVLSSHRNFFKLKNIWDSRPGYFAPDYVYQSNGFLMIENQKQNYFYDDEAQRGYYKLPNGLLIQWGFVPVAGDPDFAGGTVDILAYSQQYSYSVFVTPRMWKGDRSRVGAISGRQETASQFSFAVNGRDSEDTVQGGVSWLTVGF